MLIKTDRWLRGDDIPASEITPQHLFDQRRRLLAAAALGAAGAALSPWAARRAFAASPAPAWLAAKPNPAYATVEKPTPFDEVTTYNNFYEFGTDKSDPARYAGTLRPHPWQVSVEGLVKAPKTYDLDDLMKMAPMEERIYRLRCVEGWSMVIPWVGFPLAELIRRVEPQGSARYIQFISLADKRQMPGVSSPVLDWPYSEGLRMDEAMHPLVLLTFGLYGQVLPNQNGAPVRVIVPWKYGFKSAKSIVRIRFVDKQPPTSWNIAAPNEYGFYSNVNPSVDHPRWSQATERRIGEDKGGFGGLFAPKRKTLMFNGYDQVASLYTGMDLRKFF
ncbi:protein-methionine-sulfoxide reductase catalytic subunit MsrP [Ralstonia pseudosolanacearum]|uniref:Protein-methionine-sulfoxide reductase catalytic subunit MsrP n=7 Tax=Ralstonia solanacearum species complex TaxID=3116862 RepID=MSRP_RALN1|nr:MULTISPECIES: protein-methionine-sulfoxide reductase catalytic subunit MsrP [Ralstonia]Q8XV50.1 RecName: Full=Protein-methionine-sulfoxide reductase catalytic subunit MsrP; Flags: Precursor [Ralstonia pseudosolanacearum GMI1000]MCF1444686.1 protein-methionine-sulfoxide reductase catalytic subunit MsrP [Ralstonia solanacearum]AST28475.1 mononuclear molybdenum enzyme YedY [Ralstonia pseudosolanacearum]MDC6284229.1 protein-methionine-sulfoxide reductase catalytic subunit MsrP [Ralstonia pseudos